MKKFVPNTKLPKGAKLFKRVRKAEVGNWVEMEFDAYLMRDGITWLRVKDGLGQRGDREDWIAELPEACCSVSEDNWRKSKGAFSFRYHGTFEQAMDQELKDSLEHLKHRQQKAFDACLNMQTSISKIEKALKR